MVIFRLSKRQLVKFFGFIYEVLVVRQVARSDLFCASKYWLGIHLEYNLKHINIKHITAVEYQMLLINFHDSTQSENKKILHNIYFSCLVVHTGA